MLNQATHTFCDSLAYAEADSMTLDLSLRFVCRFKVRLEKLLLIVLAQCVPLVDDSNRIFVFQI